MKINDNTFLTDALTGEEVGKEELENRIERAGVFLKDHGVTSGDKVIMVMENSIAFSVTFLAVTGIGAVAVPVNTALKKDELAFIISDAEAGFVITDSCFSDRVFEACMASGHEYRAESSSALEAKERESMLISLSGRLPSDMPEGIALMMYTSGTTGKPKGVMLSFENLLSKTEDITKAHALTGRDTVLCLLPWFHINGLVITLLTGLVTGQHIVIGGRFSVSRFWDLVEKHRPTWFSGVPAMFSHLLSRGIPENVCGNTSLRFARSASSALPGSVLKEFEEKTKVPVIESYGITEGCAQITTNPLPPSPRKVRSVGLPYGNEIMIAGSDGREMPRGRSGEVWIRGRNITCGYYHRPEETLKSFTGSWFHTGDAGYIDEDGYLFLNGRIKELINRGGEKFAPVEIDEVLYTHPSVELAAAIGRPDPVYGEVPVAFVKLKSGCKPCGGELIGLCAEKLARFKVPVEIYFVDGLPLGGNGKVQRLKLLEMM